MKRIYLLLLLALSGCDKADKESVENLYYLEDPLYEVYFSSDVRDAEAALKDILELVESYENKGFDVIPNLMQVHYRLYDLYKYLGAEEVAAMHLQESVGYYAKLGPPFGPGPEEIVDEDIHRLFLLLEEARSPMWKKTE